MLAIANANETEKKPLHDVMTLYTTGNTPCDD